MALGSLVSRPQRHRCDRIRLENPAHASISITDMLIPMRTIDDGSGMAAANADPRKLPMESMGGEELNPFWKVYTLPVICEVVSDSCH